MQQREAIQAVDIEHRLRCDRDIDVALKQRLPLKIGKTGQDRELIGIRPELDAEHRR